jgi:hypothetical protein
MYVESFNYLGSIKQTVQDVRVKLNPGFSFKKSIQQEGSLQQQF